MSAVCDRFSRRAVESNWWPPDGRRPGVPLSERLIEILTRATVEVLRPHVGASTIALLDRMGSAANAPRGLAELIVSQLGAAGALRSKDIRSIVFAALKQDEKINLCTVLDLPTGDPVRTLGGAPLDKIGNKLELLFNWFHVPFETEDRIEEEETRRTSPVHKLHDHQRTAFLDLRRCLAEPGGAVLLHMPVGAGKLRIAATALVDLYRSEPDGRVMLWLAHDPALCSHAFNELEDAWRTLGSRNVILYRHYGCHRSRDLNEVADGIVVADVRHLAQDAGTSALERLGGRTRVVVLNEAQQADAAAYTRVLQALGPSQSRALVGLSAAPGSVIRSARKDASHEALFPSRRVTLQMPDPIDYLQSEGLLGRLVLEQISSPTSEPLALEDGDLDVSAYALAELADDRDRNSCILEKVRAEVADGANVVLFATSAA